MILPYSKTCAPADFALLTPQLAVVDRHDCLAGQAHALRRWEYAMALYTLEQWRAEHPGQLLQQLCDVGGAGSHFREALAEYAPVTVIDPAEGPQAVEDVAATDAPAFDALISISVIEHVDEPATFLRACHRLLRPGGLLFLTTDCWGCDGPDTAHFHWMRKRIYNPGSLVKLQGKLRHIGFRSYGAADWHYNGDQLFGSYSFASLAVVKR